MLGAIYIGLSGMDAYSQGLQTISNNVANLNTTGFKSTNVRFTDLFSHGGSGRSDGTTADQTGNGVRTAAPLTDFAQGDLRASQNDLDLAIDGNGFFVLRNDARTIYARTGQFAINEAGDLVQQGTENRLATLEDGGGLSTLNIDGKRTNPPVATTKITFQGNLSSTGTEASVTDIAVYNSRGTKDVWAVAFTKSTEPGATNDWTVVVRDAAGATVGTSTLKFIGNILDSTSESFTVSRTLDGADPLSVTLDFSSGVTSFSGGTSSTIRASDVDGRPLGTLTTVTVTEEGKVKLTYSNGETDTLAAIAIADFRDPQLLQRIGEGLYEDNRGTARRLLASGIDGAGKILSKRIEASNVDLSAQFGDLILIQRGYQASSQVVSVANDMIQQLFGIRGQG